MRVLVLLESDGQALTSASCSAITAANQLTDQVDGLFASHQVDHVAETLAKLAGVQTVYTKIDPALEHGLAEPIAFGLFEWIKDDYDAIVAPHSSYGRNIMPRLAAYCDCPAVSDVSQMIDHQTFVTPIYAGNAYHTVTNTADKKLLTIRATHFDPVATNQSNTPVVEANDLTVQSDKRITCDRVDVSKSDLPELATADIVISGGRGVGSKAMFEQLASIAKKLNAAVGASRAAVDAGYVTNDYQVGQTGKIVSPKLYIAIGLSGAIQHLAGMKDSQYIVAINQDPDAPIFKVCDYGLVADLFDALPAFEKALDAA